MYVYFARTLTGPRMLKVGKARAPAQRVAELQTGCPFELELVGSLKCKSEQHAMGIEKAAHAMFRRAQVRGEWFEYNPHIERAVMALLERPADDLRATVRESFDRDRERSRLGLIEKLG